MQKQSKYKAEEILEYFRADYIQRSAYDWAVEKGQELTFETSILEWREICDLVDVEDLWQYLDKLFKMDKSNKEWMQILKPENKVTLRELCEFIAINTAKIGVKPRKLFGKSCYSAGIFKALMTELESRGLNTRKIRPSSKLEPLVIDSKGGIVEIVNLLNPKALPPIEFRGSRMYEWGMEIMHWGFIALIITAFLSKSLTIFVSIILIIAYLLIWIGAGMKPQKAKYEGIETVRDLIKQIEYAT